MKKQTSIDNIFYYQEKSQDILNLGLKFTFEEIGFYLTFKSAYFFHKGKIPTSKLFQFCRVFDNQEKFKKFIDCNFGVVDDFYFCQSFSEEVNFIEKKSEERKKAAGSRWENANDNPIADAIAYPNEDAIASDLHMLNTKHKTLNTKQQTLDIKLKQYIPLSEGLIFVLESKMNKSFASNIKTNWAKEIRLLIENDLKIRDNPFEDVKKAIQTIADNYGKEYFPIIESGSSLRKKFIKIEEYLARQNKSPKSNTQELFTNLKSKYQNETN